ncbi:hypothetical protein CC1G_04214 [Coprinopsis cinerea okayama7|uniref:Carbohydrate esterase family 16 protein n=1 Tax=Coprinopsis cinerea (strain Okayama-7 / 130 / ATCC MYA-4618 / FGSC 9003) TaxID=240176 RepID=A8NFA3_COPC7|nr:hypothetical protein CC1G_04214 [Coprinopsis cinerea okayama7\|eukprot:XP_001833235.1 hypothetical protein CC1G_04214 [Coprinopsis cinerea okayama7\
MSQIIAKSSHWPGFEGIRRLFIFGDSYSSVFWSHTGFSPSSHPTAQHPLGTPFPGSTFNEEDLPNWVGHLITKYCPAPRYDPSTDDQEDGFADDPLLVYNYARGGDQVSGVARQIRRLFLPIVGTKPEWAPWSENDSLFVTSVGINDCAVSREGDFPLRISLLMELQEELYANGARNFLFFDVPPIDMAPAIAEKRIQYGIEVDPSQETQFQKWNSLLLAAIRDFQSKHPDCTILVYSLYEMFSVVLDDLDTYGFPPSHKHISNGTVWLDHIHPTSKIHDLIAHFLCDFLNEVPKYEPEEDTATKEDTAE